MNNHHSRRYIFNFKDFRIDYNDAKDILENAPEGAEFKDASYYGRNFRQSTKPNGEYIYTYDTWCRHTKTWTIEGLLTCLPENKQHFIKLNELRSYFDEFTAAIQSIDQNAINSSLTEVIKASSELSAIAAEAMTKGIAATLSKLALKQAQTLAALEHLRNIEPGMIIDSEITDLIAMNVQALRIKRNQQDIKFKELFISE